MTRLLDQFEALGVLSAIDAAFGRLLARKSVRDGDSVGLAGALASAALAQGHSCLPLAALPDFIAALAEQAQARWPDEWPRVEALRAALLASPLVARNAIAAAALVLDEHERLYLRRYFVHERTVAHTLATRLPQADIAADAPAPTDHDALRAALAQLFADDARNARATDIDQRIAVLLASRSRLLIVSGGPGSGKTTTVLKLLEFAVEQARAAGLPAPRIALAAPTGKAAGRLSETLRRRGEDRADEAIAHAATTVHRLLGIHADGRRARHDRAHPLPCDLIVIDEASMLDLALAARLCEALAPSTRLILLGDRDQLAAVEAGHVFGTLCQAAMAAGGYSPALAQWLKNTLGDEAPIREGRGAPLADAFVELHGNHRFGARSAIGRLAAALRQGDGAAALRLLDERCDEARRTAISAAALPQRIAHDLAPRYAELAGATDPAAAFAIAERFRVLCALREGPFGAAAINAAIEQTLRRQIESDAASDWYRGRLVVVVGNDYRLGLFNGDIGIALASGERGALEVWFRNADGDLRALPPAVLAACEPACALTVHKAQGSEFDEVVVVLPERDARVLTRELVYTAVTRARKKVDLWTSGEILELAAARSVRRWSGLV